MAARLLQSLTDENPDLQIGCMTGIFQLFDRNQIIAGRRIVGHNHKRLLPGNSQYNNGSLEAEFNNTYQRHTGEMNLNRNASDRQRISTESSRASFSSSRSSVSSVDYDRAAQPEPSSSDRIIFPETPLGDLTMTQSSNSSRLGRQSLDLRDVVKDSMYREARGLLLKTSNKEETLTHNVKHRDSPRPLQHSRSMGGSYAVEINGKNSSLDVKESTRVQTKFREAPWYVNEARELSRPSHEQKNGSMYRMSQDAPRFSYDERELNRFSFESRETLKSTPRLSLDSREGSMLRSNSDSKSNASFKTSRTTSSNANDKVPVIRETLRTQQRPPSVVAKLMGLETLPDTTSADQTQVVLSKVSPTEDWDASRSLTTSLSTPVQISKTPLNSWKDPTSPKRKNPDVVMKPISSSRFPLEPAPWRRMDGSQGPSKPASRINKVPARPSGAFPTVYGEIEKRLKELEFRKSGKDLRALKQILEAIQAKGLIEIEKEEQGSNFESARDYDLKINSNTRSVDQRPPNHHPNAAIRGDNSSGTFNSPIVIMKPANSVQKTSVSTSSISPFEGLSCLDKSRAGGSAISKRSLMNSRTVNNQTLKNGYRDHAGNNNEKKNNSTQLPTRPQQLPKENNINSGKSSGSISPRLQQKRLELEKRSRPPTPPSDVVKPRKQSSRQPSESTSAGGKLGPKSANMQQTDDQLSEISNESKNLSYQGDDLSILSDSITMLDLKTNAEVTSSGRPAQINVSQSPSRKAITKQSVSILKQEKTSQRLSEDDLLAEHALVAPEHPSPVSVLDVYREDSLSPIKQFTDTLEDKRTQNSTGSQYEEQFNQVHNSSPNSIGSGLVSEMSHKKLQRIDNLVQKLRRLNSNHDESSTDYIASLCENTNPDHRYISEILLASGLLLRDLGSSLTTFQLHSSIHPINPELFFVLEQTKSSTLVSKEEPGKKINLSKSNLEKFHRKLIFDAVNEILNKKLASMGTSADRCFKPNKIARKNSNAQKLLKELCSEIEQLQANNKSECCSEDENDDLKGILWEDVMHRSESWTDCDGEIISGVVLDIERLLFKDLINEIVMGEAAASLRAKSGRRARKLFTK